MATPTVFISYSHDSVEHGDRVLAVANRLVGDGIDVILDQYESSPPEGWPRWMDKHIRGASFVLMVCTETYFRRVMGQEKQGTGLGVKWEGNLIYQHIYNADTTNTRFIPVLFDYCKAEHIPTPVQGATYYRIDTPDGYEDLYCRVTDQPRARKPELGKLRALPPRERKPDYLGVKISTAKLPSTSRDLFGREKELAMLDAAWEDHGTNVVSLVAWGGVGKTALVNKWLSQMGKDNWRGAERVFGWSFYSQGAAEGKQNSADLFIATALKWFGDPDPKQGSPWDKGERLAELVKRQRTLLILDGLEPLQNPPPVETGKIKDPGLCCLLRELARQNPAGFVVITTRLRVDDLKDFVGISAAEMDLDDLSPEAGAAYLAHLGVKGPTDELKQAAKDFRGHALALTLLGSYLVDVYEGDIRKRDLIPRLTDEEEKGAHARRMMEAYAKWFEGKPEQNILYMLGLFDRPAEKRAIQSLLAAPRIAGLTGEVQGIARKEWLLALKHLRSARLLAETDQNEPETLDCHPLLREDFGGKLRAENPKAWREGHSRLYDYYKSVPKKDLPDTIEEMAPLFAAVMHGCQAGKHQEAIYQVFLKRMDRGQAFVVKKLGAMGSALTALSGFFEEPWREVVSGLPGNSPGYVLNNAGFCLRAVGRLAEAVQPVQASLDSAISGEDWKNASRAADTLSELHLTLGDLRGAIEYARQGVELADQSREAFARLYTRATLADVMQQCGHVTEAELGFIEAEDIQKEREPNTPLLYSFQGFQYCDFFLSQGTYAEVQRRASQTLEWAKQHLGLLDVALDNLSLGRAHLLQSQREPNHQFTECANYLNCAVNGLRQAGQQDVLPRGLLARAELWRVTRALDKARNDLDEAYSICTRCGMRLHEAYCHLEYTRWYLASDDKTKARESLAKAKVMIEEMGYHRRDKEVKDLEARLGDA
jgi:tetratricopeptide (TPR) repeat protein